MDRGKEAGDWGEGKQKGKVEGRCGGRVLETGGMDVEGRGWVWREAGLWIGEHSGAPSLPLAS